MKKPLKLFVAFLAITLSSFSFVEVQANEKSIKGAAACEMSTGVCETLSDGSIVVGRYVEN